MKMKSFAMFAMAGLFVGSCTYLTPSFAEGTDNADAQAAQVAPSDQTSASADAQNNINVAQNDDKNGSSTDQGSPDLATGDDDY